ncbi:MAG: hypothetical protein ACI4V5_03405 [Prevotella sp.]
MRYIRYVFIVLAATFLVSCGDTEYEYSNYSCYFVFDNMGSRSPMLAAAMNQNSPGTFCHIRTSGKAYIFDLNTSPGQTEKVNFTAEDERRTLLLGIYNESGIIVGYGNYNNPATFYAYDNQCRYCYEETGLSRYPLTMDTSGKASCARCKRIYDLNNGGIEASGGRLIRYHATTSGPLGVLSVVNGR